MGVISMDEQRVLTNVPYKQAKQVAIRSFDRVYISGLLREFNGNISRASKKAGLDRSNFRRLIKKYNIDPVHYKKG